MARDRRIAPVHLLLIALAALLAVLPLAFYGCSCGHDFDFHLVSWLDAANQFSHGDLHPHWAFSPAFNAGEPRFIFYPPISWYLGAGIGLALEHLPGISPAEAWNAAPVVFTWIALALSGAAMYRLARDYALPAASLAAAMFYLMNPYMLFTAYERTAYAELLAAAWIPLLLHSILRPRISLPRIAIPLALLWLTNAPAAVIGSYIVAFLAVCRVVAAILRASRSDPASHSLSIRTSPKPGWLARFAEPVNLALMVVAGGSLGLLAAAFYIVPAAYERRFVQIRMAVLPGMRIADNFLFHHTSGPDAALHDQVLHTASVVAVFLWTAAAALLLVNHLICRRTGRVHGPASHLRRLPTALLAMLLFAVGFALTPWSARLWTIAPEAAFLQFPWRAAGVLAVIAALALAHVLTRAPATRGLVSGVAAFAAAALFIPFYAQFRQGCDPEDTPAARLASFASHQGSEPTDEYTPANADNDVLGHRDPPYWIATNPGTAPPKATAPGAAPMKLSLRLQRPAELVLNLRTYPGWTVLLDGAPDLQRIERSDGLIALPLPRGVSTVELKYSRLPDQKLGDLLSLIGLGLLAGSALPLRWRSEPHLHPATAPQTQPPARPGDTSAL